MLKQCCVMFLVVTVVISAVAWAEPTLEETEKAISDLSDQVNDYKGTIAIDSTRTGAASTVSMTTTGTVECLKKDGVLKYRTDLTSKIPMPNGELEQKSLIVFDGTDLYTEVETGGQKFAMKDKPDLAKSVMPVSGKALFEMLHAKYNLKALPEESVEGEPAFAIEVESKELRDGKPVAKFRCYFSKKNGLQVKFVQIGPDDKPMSTVLYKDIKINTGLLPERFLYKPGDGVTVLDQTQVMQFNTNK